MPSYTLMILLGIAAGYAAIARRGSIYGISAEEVTAVYILAAVGSFLGGKTMFILQGIRTLIEQSARGDITFVEYAQQAGLVFYGGLFGCLLFLWLSSLAFRTPFWSETDAVLPALPLAQSFGRVGCFLAGCCYGVPSSFGFDMSASDIAPHGVTLFPVQLAESVVTLALFIVLYRMGRTRNRPGRMLGTYLLMYGVARFILEFFRYDAHRGFAGALSVSQWISVFSALWGATMLFSESRHRRLGRQRRLLKY